MHEYSLIQSLIGRVEQEARARGAVAVHRLKVRLGEQAGVDPELFQTAYDTFRGGTVCEKARLELVRVPPVWACRSCGETVAPTEVLTCPRCSGSLRLTAGNELILDPLELEVP